MTESHPTQTIIFNDLGLLKKLAKAPTETALGRALQSLHESQYWKTNSDLRDWFEKKWLSANRVNERNIY